VSRRRCVQPGAGFGAASELCCGVLDIHSQTREEIQAQFEAWGQPAYRVGQLLEWLYSHRAVSWDAMTNLPQKLRAQLRDHFSLHTIELIRRQGAGDTTQKFLWRLPDHALIESVLIPANPALYGEASDRRTLCVSTQVGCAYGCRFCASGLEGWKRNLGVEEIVEQVLAVERWYRRSQPAIESQPLANGVPASTDVVPGSEARAISNLVIMGMGEPLANFENLMKALEILNASWGGGIGARKITISTSGLAPQIRRLADEPPQYRLAVSLHGATDDVRSRIMPVNRKYPLKELVSALEYYQQCKGSMITFEYILISGVNDQPQHVRPLAVLARHLNAKVNLIPYNVVEGLPFDRPTEQMQEAFLRSLSSQRVTATLRREKGHDIDAACGQLRLKQETQDGIISPAPAKSSRTSVR
jgi:23S rRNA (adenine2503-C2)-methyltransferase